MLLAAPIVANAQPFAYVLGRAFTFPAPPTDTGGVQTLIVINTATNAKVAEISLDVGCCSQDNIVVSSNASRVYVANQVAGTISVVDASTNAVISTISVGSVPTNARMNLALSPDGARLYVLRAASLLVIGLKTLDTVATIPLGSSPNTSGIALNPDGSRLYVSDFGFSRLTVVDTVANRALATIPLADRPHGLDVTPDGGLVYVASGSANAVFVVSTATNAVVATIGISSPRSPYPNSARSAPDGRRVYAANLLNDTISVIDRQTNTVVSTIAGVLNPRMIDFSADGARAFVTGSFAVWIINTTNHTVSGTIRLTSPDFQPGAIAIATRHPCITDARRIVDELYRRMLERPSDFGSSALAERLTTGAATVRDLVREIAKSPEHTQRFFNPLENDAYLRAVETLYRHVLGRQPDAGGARGLAELARLSGFDAVVDELVGSAEYQQQFGDWGVAGSGGVQYCGAA
jgi:YVTN family beta-propeller protein